MAASSLNKNLLSLRHFVDQGLSIHLDDRVLKIFDKDTGETIICGMYEKPMWGTTS